MLFKKKSTGDEPPVTEVQKENTISDSTNDELTKDTFSFTAFLFTFIYYFVKKDYVTGSVVLLVVALMPLKDYLLVGLIIGFFVGKGRVRERYITASGILVACLGILAFCLLKFVRYMLLGNM